MRATCEDLIEKTQRLTTEHEEMQQRLENTADDLDAVLGLIDIEDWPTLKTVPSPDDAIAQREADMAEYFMEQETERHAERTQYSREQAALRTSTSSTASSLMAFVEGLNAPGRWEVVPVPNVHLVDADGQPIEGLTITHRVPANGWTDPDDDSAPTNTRQANPNTNEAVRISDADAHE